MVVLIRDGLRRFLQNLRRKEIEMAARLLLSVLLMAVSACATLQNLRGLVQPPRFEEATGQQAEVRILGPNATQPLGGAGVRIWTRVTNPNPFGLTVGTLRGTLHLEDTRAANVDFPLGLPLEAGAESVVPIDLSISFEDLPGLANVMRRAAAREPLEYRLEGTIGVDAGRLGQPTFGPMTLVTGDLLLRRSALSTPNYQLPTPTFNSQLPTPNSQVSIGSSWELELEVGS